MARRQFTLDLDIDNPADKDCKRRDGQPADKLTQQEFLNMLDNGSLTAIGQVYRGIFPGMPEATASYTADSDITGRKCSVVYIGGTAYKICD